jgi:cysteinyl-tRNA synthetase
MFRKYSTKLLNGEWKKPQGIKTGIFLFNSLTKEKNELILSKPYLSWYLCGPTVYDYSHLGHARTYIGFDIVRRILENYFQINMKTVINITDIDDKIMRKGYLKQLELKINQIQTPNDLVKEFQLKLQEDSKFVEKKLESKEILKMIESLNEISPMEVKEQFSTVSKHFEALFWKDMKALNVKMPNNITRVTEYIPEIITFIEKIINRGYAYLSNGSVYFDTKHYSNSHVYCKLEPQSISNFEKSSQGEEESFKDKKNEKKSIQDFVLWKKSNLNEPSWSSPWVLNILYLNVFRVKEGLVGIVFEFLN